MDTNAIWWNADSKLPLDDENFIKIIDKLVFHCPASYSVKENKTTSYRFVSARNASFRERGICGGDLTTLLAQIKNPISRNNMYLKLTKDESVDEKVAQLLAAPDSDAARYDVMVVQERAIMTDTESIFYCIRNAFAHGAFEVRICQSTKVYYLENSKDGKTKSKMRLREDTLLRYAELSQLKVKDIKNLKTKHIKSNKKRR